MKSQRSNSEKDKLIEEGKRIRMNKIIRQDNGNRQSLIFFVTYKKWLIEPEEHMKTMVQK